MYGNLLFLLRYEIWALLEGWKPLTWCVTLPHRSGVYRVATQPHFRGSRGVKCLCSKINYRPNITALRLEQSIETANGHGTGTDFLLGQRSGAGGVVVCRSAAMNVGLSRDGKHSFISDLALDHKRMCLGYVFNLRSWRIFLAALRRPLLWVL
jgi:hypothetical protein